VLLLTILCHIRSVYTKMSVCLLACNPFQFMDSVIRLYVVLPLITSGEKEMCKIRFQTPKNYFQIFDLEVLFWTSLSHIWVKLFLN